MDSRFYDKTLETMSVPGSYFGFEKFDSANQAINAFQINPIAWKNNCKLRGEFDTLQVFDGCFVPKSFGELTDTMGNGTLSAALFSGVAQVVIALGANATGQIGNLLTGTMKEFNINQTKWAGATGVAGESVVPTLIDIKNSMTGEN
jgi:hypothetical protein